MATRLVQRLSRFRPRVGFALLILLFLLASGALGLYVRLPYWWLERKLDEAVVPEACEAWPALRRMMMTLEVCRHDAWKLSSHGKIVVRYVNPSKLSKAEAEMPFVKEAFDVSVCVHEDVNGNYLNEYYFHLVKIDGSYLVTSLKDENEWVVKPDAAVK